MGPYYVLIVAFVFAFYPYVAVGQFCNDYTVSRIIYAEITTSSPIFRPEIELYGDATVLSSHTRLTKAGAGSFGGFFLAAPTEFQGPGGFSVKFTLKSIGGGGGSGDAWELIIARGNAAVLPAPFGIGTSAHGKSGWSRREALVIEFDARNSGSGEKDSSENHISVFLDGAEQCESKISSDFDDGQKRTVWVDYIGFKSTLEVFLSSPNSSKRPSSPTLRCSIDVWAKLNINQRYHVGFAAYNSPNAAGVEHTLVDGISVSDAYRPFDARYCAVYAPCRAVDDQKLCIIPIGNNICELQRCDTKYVWDVTGDRCCGFIEKASWVVKGNVTNFYEEGHQAPCVQDRKTISFTADDRFCK